MREQPGVRYAQLGAQQTWGIWLKNGVVRLGFQAVSASALLIPPLRRWPPLQVMKRYNGVHMQPILTRLAKNEDLNFVNVDVRRQRVSIAD